MTAVNWLIEELKKVHHPTEAMIMYAKKLEREQHGKTWDSAIEQGEKRAWNISRLYTDFDDYFAETYGSKGSDDHIVDTNEMVEDTFKVWECCGMEECICKGSDETKNDSAKCGIIDNVDYWEKTLEYWKAEKQISNIGSTYYGLCCAKIGIIEDFFKCIQPIDATSSQTEHNSPKVENKDSFGEISDEEITKLANEHILYNDSKRQWVIEGMKLYREQLKQRQ